MAKKAKVDALNYAGELKAYVKVHEEFDALKVKEKEIIARINKDHSKSVDFAKKENTVIDVDGKSYALNAVIDRNNKKPGSEKVFKYTIHAATIIKEEEKPKTAAKEKKADTVEEKK